MSGASLPMRFWENAGKMGSTGEAMGALYTFKI
jgi:hypothetical protein